MTLKTRFWQRILLLLLASTWAVFAATPATGGRRALQIELSRDLQTAKVNVPDGVATVILQRFKREGGWTKVASREATPGVMRFKLPESGAKARWRAIGQVKAATPSREKFPAAFYRGKNQFEPVKTTASSTSGILGGNSTSLPGIKSDSSVSSPVEADIWKIDGNTVYFFNQLRGLQVLDVTDPADPRLTASLRLPAVGQDLYLLPGSGKERTLVLLTQNSNNYSERIRINVVKVSGSTVEITNTRDVPGYLSDSRMVDNRLILAATEWNLSEDNVKGSWDVRSRLSEWIINPGVVPQADGETSIEGYNPVIAASADWLALAVNPKGRWDVSEVSVFAIRSSGLVRMAAPFTTEGSVAGKFAMQWSNNVLTTISQKNDSEDGWSPVTVLENFRAWAPEVVHAAVLETRLGRLPLAEGESLFATRFAGNKAYIVTFLRTDPLFVVDLSDPANPVVAGEIEVPGWSSHLEPLGDLLFSIGWESNTVVASLFDVADPASPQLLRRLKLGEPGTYSEAMWDEKALRVLPEAGLAMIPLASYDWKSGASSSMVQLLDIDAVGRDLSLRGAIAHEFDARRADLLENAVVSISQRVMVTADISDRDAPSILSEVSLAWPVDRVFEIGDYLIQIENGSSYGGGNATARISPANATEAILSETVLGKGTVKAADCRDGKLYILRDTSASRSFYYFRSPMVEDSNPGKLVLDIYDASKAPELTLLGSCSVATSDSGQMALDHLLWPQPNRPAMVMDFRYSYWYNWGGPIRLFDAGGTTGLVQAATPRKVAATSLVYRPYWAPQKAPRLIVFDTTDLQNPTAGDPVVLGPDGSSINRTAEAADGLIVLGNTQWRKPKTDEWFESGTSLQTARVIEVESSGTPVVRPLVDLPGELFAVSELDRGGFLAFTRRISYGEPSLVEVSACDGYDAFSIATTEVPAYREITAGGRRIFIASENGVDRRRLSDDGVFVNEEPLEIGWSPYTLHWIDGTLIGGNWRALFAADAAGTEVTKWKFPTWNPGVERIVIGSGGDLLVPFGDYGVERLER